MGFFSSVFGGIKDFVEDSLGAADDLAHLDFKGAGDRVSDNVQTIGDGFKGVGDWVGDIYDFHMNQGGNWWDKFKNNPLQLAVGAGDPFSTKVWNKVLDKEWTPYVSSMGGSTQDQFQDAERKGIDTGAHQGMSKIADTIASFYGGGALGGLAGSAGSAAGIGATAGQTIGGAAVGAGNAWANGGKIGQGALMGAAPSFLNGVAGGNVNIGDNGEWGNYKGFYDNGGGAFTGLGDSAGVAQAAQTAAQPTWMQTIGQAVRNPAGSVGITNPMAQGLVNSGLRGAVSGAFQGNAGQGALQGMAGNAIGQGLGSFGNGNTTFGVNNQRLGSNVAAGLMGLYGANQAKKALDGQIGNLNSLFSQNSPYAQVMQEQLARKDAAAGRRSQGGQRAVELQARLAELNSRNAPMLNQLYSQRDAQKQSQLKDIYTTLRNTGILDKLGSSAMQYFQPAQVNPYKDYFDGGQG